MSTWFTADLHFGHANILLHHPSRGASLDEMHARIVDNWNACVRPGDEVYLLGDFYMGKATDDTSAATWFHALKGKKHLIAGNHDHAATMRLPWSSTADLGKWKQKPHRAVLCHYPMLTWNGAHHGVWMLHGHSHGLLAPSRTTRLDVGIDCHPEFRPFSVDEIVHLMSEREYIVVDGHGRGDDE